MHEIDDLDKTDKPNPEKLTEEQCVKWACEVWDNLHPGASLHIPSPPQLEEDVRNVWKFLAEHFRLVTPVQGLHT